MRCVEQSSEASSVRKIHKRRKGVTYREKKLLSKEKKEKGKEIEKECVSTDTKESKASKHKERKEKSDILCKSSCFSHMQPSYGLSCVGVTPSL